MEAVLSAPDASTWTGQRDRVMLATFYNTGARVSEILSLLISDAQLDRSASLRIHGKGRKQRRVPLWKSTADKLRGWMARLAPGPDGPLFPSRDGKPLSRDGVEKRLRAAVEVAALRCPSLRGRRVSPHTLRHTTAMHLLQSGVDITVIALRLGHESPVITHLYLEADLAMKEEALKRVQEPSGTALRYRPTDRLRAFLEAL